MPMSAVPMSAAPIAYRDGSLPVASTAGEGFGTGMLNIRSHLALHTYYS